jgi:hypothetical protein
MVVVGCQRRPGDTDGGVYLPLWPKRCGEFVGLPDPPLVDSLRDFVSVEKILEEGGFGACHALSVIECHEGWYNMDCTEGWGDDQIGWFAEIKDGTEIYYYSFGKTRSGCGVRVGVRQHGYPCETDYYLLQIDSPVPTE